MDAKTYLKISAINLVFLLVGVLIGVTIMEHVVAVHAQDKGPAAKVEPSPTKPPEDPNVEYVSPSITLGGPVLTSALLASRIACDRLQVNGYDILKLNEAMLRFLEQQHVATQTDIQNIIQAGKAERPLRIKPQ